MTDFIAQPKNQALIKLSGTIKNLKVTRNRASFVFTPSDQTKMGVIAIAAAAAGMGGQAMSTAANASDMEEEADYVEFELNGQPVKGWVWRNPFKEGDTVEVAAEWQNFHYETFGIARPKDKTIALYPHCSRGKTRHNKNSIKWWLIGGGGSSAAFLLLDFVIAGWVKEELPMNLWFVLGFFTFFGLMTFSLSRKWMPFVRVAEKVFRTLELPNPGNIDLVKSSKAQRTEQDPGEFGTFYFRY